MKQDLVFKVTMHTFAVALFVALMGSCTPKSSLNENLEVIAVETAPDVYFQSALETFARQDYRASSESIARAVESIQLLLPVADSVQDISIKNAIADLNDLSSDVLFDKVDGIEELNYVFAKTGKAIAGLRIKITERFFYALDGNKAGIELNKAVGQMERSIKYYKSEVSAGEKKLFDETREMALKLTKGENIDTKMVEEQLGKLDEELNASQTGIDLRYESLTHKGPSLQKSK